MKNHAAVSANQLKTAFYTVNTFLSIAFLATSSTVFAQSAQGQPAFQKMQELIYSYAGLIGSYIIVPIGVLALIVNVVQLIWQMMTGNTHSVGSKLGWILFTILITTFGVWLGTNAKGIFI